MKFCPNCGAQIDANDKFCTNCGAALNDGSATTPAQPTQVQVQPVQQVQPTQPIQEVQPVLNASRTVTATKKKGFNLKFLIIAIVVVLAVAGFSFYKYRTSPAHNPNNPLANQTITFKQYDDGFQYLSESSFNQIIRNMVNKMIAKVHINNQAAKDLENANYIEIMQDSEGSEKLQEKFKADTTPAEQKRLYAMGKDVIAMGKGIQGEMVKVSPSKNLKNGEKVTLRLNVNPQIAQKYGIDLTPRTVKVQGLKN